jgi:sortase A
MIYSAHSTYDSTNLLPATLSLEENTPTLALAATTIIKRGDYLGVMAIPRLNRAVRIYEGTERAQLKKGAGHYEKSVLPGIVDNSVIAGHRDTVFSQFGLLQRGDKIIVTTRYGKFTYIIEKFRIVDGNDRTVIVPTKRAILTLSTCYPFQYVGSAPQRFIVTAVLAK